jgi:branched-chain amino acid aminotransferase
VSLEGDLPGTDSGPVAAASVQAAASFLPQGSYTTLRTYGRTGVIELESHLQRLEDSARRLGHHVTLDHRRVRRLLCEILQGQTWEESPESRVRLTVDCSHRVGELWISIEPLPMPSREQYHNGVAAVTRAMHRRNPLAKDSAFISESRDARELISDHINEVLMIGPEGTVLEGLSSNFFGILDGELLTASEGVLPGITRSLILQEAHAAGVPVRLRAIPAGDVVTLDEAFISSSSRGLLPLVEIDGKAIGDGKPGPLTRLLGERYLARVEKEIDWLCSPDEQEDGEKSSLHRLL